MDFLRTYPVESLALTVLTLFIIQSQQRQRKKDLLIRSWVWAEKLIALPEYPLFQVGSSTGLPILNL